MPYTPPKSFHSVSTKDKPGSQLWRKAQPTDYVGQACVGQGHNPFWWSLPESNQRLLLLRIVYLHLYEATIYQVDWLGLSILRDLGSGDITSANAELLDWFLFR